MLWKKDKQPVGSMKLRLHRTVEILLQIVLLFAVQRLAWFPRVLCIPCKLFFRSKVCPDACKLGLRLALFLVFENSVV